MTTAPPTKLFREEAKTGAIDCPACGAPITLHGFGGVEQIACSYCGTICKGNPETDGNLDIVQRVERARRQSILPLHIRGRFSDAELGGGSEWEIIGIVWREVVVDGSAYPWQEFLLFNPYEGYRWLIYQMSDGVWSIGGPLDGAVEIKPGFRPTAHWQGETYKHFTTGDARTTYVEGEFPWQVLVGDVAQTNDYICPPKLISIEVQRTDGGADLNFTQMVPLAPEQVWAAFKRPGEPPPCLGIHPAAPNPHDSPFFRRAGLAFGVLWLLATFMYIGARDKEVVYHTIIRGTDMVGEELKFGDPDRKQTLELELRANGMRNSWAFTEVMLVNAETEEALAVGLEVAYYTGVDGGESWSEGSTTTSTVLGGVPGGKYILQAQSQFDNNGDVADSLELTITRDVALARYVLLALLVIAGFPLINLFRRMSFEAKRWSTSDYAATSSSD